MEVPKVSPKKGRGKKTSTGQRKPVAPEAECDAPAVPAVPANAKKFREVFNAIVSFVNDLNDVFGTTKAVKGKASSLALYHRLIQNLKTGDYDGIAKAVLGFRVFLSRYELALIKNDLTSIPEGTCILYGNSERICIEIQKYMYQSRNHEDTLTIIRQHLLTIGMIIDPTPDKCTTLENAQKEREAMMPGIDTSTKEGQFINDILETAKSGMAGINTNDPMTAMMGVYKSGALQKMMTGLNDGSMNPRSLGRMMKKTLNALIPDEDEEEPVAVPTETPTASSDVVEVQNQEI